MSLIIAFLTFVLVMNCLFLILLVLIQLPKKEAGAGIAFGGAATDALFGAGSGNALTKMTKYTATTFIGLSVLLSVLNTQAARQGTRRLEQELSKQVTTAAPVIPSLPASNAPAPAVQTAPATNLLAIPASNAPAAATPAPAPAAPAAEAPTAAPAAAAPAPAK